MDAEKIELSKYRLQTAEECLRQAEIMMINNQYKGCANRSYYAIFNAIRAVFALDFKDYKSHAAAISFFQKDYIRTGKIEKRFSKVINHLFKVRIASDYEDFYIISKEEVTQQCQNAQEFISEIKRYIASL